MAKNKRSQNDWDKYNWGLWGCEREIKLDCPWGRWNICKAVLAKCFKAQLVLACGQALLASGAGEGWPFGTGTEQVIACCDLNYLAEILLFCEGELTVGHRELWFYGALLGRTGTTAVTVWDGLFKEFECQAPSCHGKSVGFRCLKFLPPRPPSSEPCAYHHPDHFPCVISLPAPHVYTWVWVFGFFFLPLFQKQLKSFRQDCNLNSWGKASEHGCTEWMQHHCWPVKSGNTFKFWGMLRWCGCTSVNCATTLEQGCVWGQQQCHGVTETAAEVFASVQGRVSGGIQVELCLYPFHGLFPVLWNPR